MKEPLAYWLLVLAPVVFAIRAVVAFAGGDPSDVLALRIGAAAGGILSAVAFVLLAWHHYKGPDFIKVLAAVAVAFLGHYVVDRWVDEGLGAAMVYLGTGAVASLRVRVALYAGATAGAGALIRDEVAAGHLILAAGAVALAACLVVAARRAAPGPAAHARSNAENGPQS